MKGEVIAFIGAPGVGTSFLTKQMASKNCCPGFFEGEEGVFTDEAINKINSEIDTPERYDWFLDRTKTMLEKAHVIAKSGITSYVDGDVLLIEAWLKAEIGDQSPLVLKKWIKDNKNLQANKVIVLTASEKKLKENIASRGRASEQTDFIKQRAVRIEEECKNLENKYEHVKLLDRSDLDFSDRQALDFVDKIIKKMSFYKH